MEDIHHDMQIEWQIDLQKADAQQTRNGAAMLDDFLLFIYCRFYSLRFIFFKQWCLCVVSDNMWNIITRP